VQAKQDGELDPQRVTRVSPGAFPRNQDRDGTLDRHVATHRLSSTLTLHVGSLGKTPSRSIARHTARRPIQSGEVEPSSHRSPHGIVVPDLSSLLRSLLCASVRHPARHAGPRWFSYRPYRHLRLIRIIFFASLFLSPLSPRSLVVGFTMRRTVWRQTPPACASGDTPSVRSWPRAPTALSSCHACVPDVATTSWLPAWLAASSRPPR
jgi:hypothetical protein